MNMIPSKKRRKMAAASQLGIHSMNRNRLEFAPDTGILSLWQLHHI
jgi:hypothetical protein